MKADYRKLPLQHLSVGSVNQFLKCPEKWRRRYIANDYEPPGGAMLAGRAVGAAENQHYSNVIEGGDGLSTEDVLDAFTDAWKLELETKGDDADWRTAKPDDVRTTSATALSLYHEQVAPGVRPVAIERKFVLRVGEAEWTLVGYLDLDLEDVVADLKLRGRRMSAEDAFADIQPDAYLAARRAEGRPTSSFDFHTMVRSKRTPRAEVVETSRDDERLDHFLTDRLLGVASEIAWRTEFDVWQGAPPGAWWCSDNFCGFWSSCPFGGLAQTRAAQGGRNA